MESRIEIQLSKKKLHRGILGSLAFVIAGFWLFLNANEFENMSLVLLQNPVVVKTIGVLEILFFGAIGIFTFRKAFDKKIGLTIDIEGILDNSSALSIGLIPWDDISGIRVKRVISAKFLMIDVVDPEKYIEKAKNGIAKLTMRINMKMYGSPIAISATAINYDFEELETLIKDRFEKNKKTSEN